MSHASRIRSWTRSPWVIAPLVLLLLHVWLVRNAIQNGDGAVYNDQIESRLVGIRTTHVGYILCGLVADRVLPFGVERSVNLMCLAFASGGGAAAFLIARSLGASRYVAAAAPLLVFAIHAYLRGAVLAEVDVVACALVLVAVASWLRGRILVAGLSFGLAMLVTPVTAMSLPMLVLTVRRERGAPARWRTHLRDLLLFAAVSLAVYAPLVGVFWHDYWFGGRGLLHAPREPWDVGKHVARSFAFLTSSAGPWLWLGLAAVIAGPSPGAPLAPGVAAAALPFCSHGSVRESASSTSPCGSRSSASWRRSPSPSCPVCRRLACAGPCCFACGPRPRGRPTSR